MSTPTTELLGALAPGTILHEYEIQRVLGHGGFGITYLAHDRHLQKTVAIKEYLPADIAGRKSDGLITVRIGDQQEAFNWGRQQFMKEARVLARFQHPNLIQIHRFFEANGSAYFVMEYAEGEALDVILKRERSLPEERLRALLMPLLSGLEQVHRAGVLHRDIKPGNIILRRDGVPVLIDFGAARQDLSSMTRSMMSALTGGYAPIEQYASAGNQGPWTDIYAFGAVIYRAISGKRPIDAVMRVREDPLVPASMLGRGSYSEHLLAAVEWAMGVDPDDRPRCIADWRLALDGHKKPPPRLHAAPFPPQEASASSEPPVAVEADRAHEATLVVAREPVPAPAESALAEKTLVLARDAGPAPESEVVALVAEPAARVSAPHAAQRPDLPRVIVIAGAAALLLLGGMLIWAPWKDSTPPASVPEPSAPDAAVVAPPARADTPVPPPAPAPEVKAAPAFVPPAARAAEPAAVAPAPVAAKPSVKSSKPPKPPKPLKPATAPAAQPVPAAQPAPAIQSVPTAKTTVAKMKPRSEFRDCPTCPRMLVLPPGRFEMGAASGSGVNRWEQPPHAVRIGAAFAIGRFEVTDAEWQECANAKACAAGSGGRGELPAVQVSWNDAQAYTAWLSKLTKRHYRLPSEAEWEYAIRAGASTSRYWGDTREDQCAYANAADRSAARLVDPGSKLAECDDRFGGRAPVGRLRPNAFGLHDMAGNAWEWVQDCWRDSYAGAPADGSAVNDAGCKRHVIRGGSWRTKPESLRSAARGLSDSPLRSDDLGLRVAAE